MALETTAIDPRLPRARGTVLCYRTLLLVQSASCAALGAPRASDAWCESVEAIVARPYRPPQRRASLRRRFARMGRAQAVFTVLALLVVCSLIAGTVGAAVVDEINRRNADDLTSVPEASEDVFESELRDDIEQNPEDVDSMAALGNYLAQTGRLDEGIGWYEKALGIAPTNSAIRLDFARDLAGGDKRQDAELQFKRVLEGQPDDPTVHFELAQLYAAWVPPRTSEAIAEYQRVVAAGQDSFITERAKEELRLLGVTASPIAGSPVPAQPTLEPTP